MAEDEDDAAKVEELTRSAVGPRNLRSQPPKAGKKIAGGLDRNRSFFGAFNDDASADKGSKRPAASPEPERPPSGGYPQTVVMQAPPVMGRGAPPPNGAPAGGHGGNAGHYYQQQNGGHGHHHPQGQQPHPGQGYAHPVPHGHPQRHGQPPADYGPAQQAQHRNQYQMVPNNNHGGGGNPNQRRL